uniref:Uncharacterized protein n=1 Tax=Chrysodeixis chalcites nucleopolyhedrovirus TaxID=320432 RepID=T1QZP5_9ABAC|nr:hypothetical protein [Chrysodeixis chalcites nucleopolyhedrovirus]AGE61825.1 hypothetical protein [Chrysodeixis chalcites nucleopolyhedrovirus]
MDRGHQNVSSLQLLCAQNLLNTLNNSVFTEYYEKYIPDDLMLEEVEQKFQDVMKPYLPRPIYENVFRMFKQINVLNWRWDIEMNSKACDRYIRCRQRKEDSLSLMCAKKIFFSIKKKINMHNIEERVAFRQEFVTKFSRYIPHYMAVQLIELYSRFFLSPFAYDLKCLSCLRYNDLPSIRCRYCNHYTCSFFSMDLDSDSDESSELQFYESEHSDMDDFL